MKQMIKLLRDLSTATELSEVGDLWKQIEAESDRLRVEYVKVGRPLPTGADKRYLYPLLRKRLLQLFGRGVLAGGVSVTDASLLAYDFTEELQAVAQELQERDL